MVSREKEFVVINQRGRYIVIVIGKDRNKVKLTSDQLVQKLKRG
jgi:hypothetical protein